MRNHQQGQKVYGIAIEYDAAIDPASLDLTTYATGIVPAARGSFSDTPQSLDKNASTQTPAPRAVAMIYRLPAIYGFVSVPLAELRVGPCACWTTGQTGIRVCRRIVVWEDRR